MAKFNWERAAQGAGMGLLDFIQQRKRDKRRQGEQDYRRGRDKLADERFELGQQQRQEGIDSAVERQTFEDERRAGERDLASTTALAKEQESTRRFDAGQTNVANTLKLGKDRLGIAERAEKRETAPFDPQSKELQTFAEKARITKAGSLEVPKLLENKMKRINTGKFKGTSFDKLYTSAEKTARKAGYTINKITQENTVFPDEDFYELVPIDDNASTEVTVVGTSTAPNGDKYENLSDGTARNVKTGEIIE